MTQAHDFLRGAPSANKTASEIAIERRGNEAAANKIIAEQSKMICALAKGLKLAASALADQPYVDGRYTARHRSVHALALVAAQAGVAMVNGAPFDASRTELTRVLAGARDAIAFLLLRVVPRATDGREIAAAERALMDLTRVVGSADDDVRPCDTQEDGR